MMSSKGLGRGSAAVATWGRQTNVQVRTRVVLLLRVRICARVIDGRGMYGRI